MKAKKILALVLTLCMVVSLFPMAYAAEEEVDALSFADAAATVLTPKLDGEDIKVTMYEDLYLANTTHADQKVAVYVPENATADSPIVLCVNNGGWQSNSYSGRNGVSSYGWVEETKRGETVTVLKGDYVSDSDSDAIGRMLAEGYVIVGYGCRSRNNGASEDGKYYGHSPATMSDTKAVVRYLRYNADLLPAGDPEKIVVTGTSGGGALSVIIAGTGDSADYFPALYESGAAGIDYVDGKYVNTISDAVWATVAYCPITDLGNACAAYEWTWGETRFAQIEAGDIEYKVPTDAQKAASEVLTAAFEEYVDSLGIGVTADTMEEEIIALMKAEIEESIKEIGIEQMKADLGDYDWLVINDDGTYTYDYEAHKYAVGLESTFKAASAFSNAGMSAWKGERNEDNLFGSLEDDYSPYNEYAWDNDDTPNAVGKDDTGLTWDEFLATENGARLQLQMKMVSPFQYLLDAEGESTSAPNWYVRYGMYDRDSSWAIEVALLECMKADKTIEDIDFEFAWLKGHSGNYDVQEAWDWVAEQAFEDAARNTTLEDATVTELVPTVDGEAVKVTWYADGYLNAPNSAKQLINIYVPETATEDSPVMLYVNNSGWMMNNYPTNTIEDGKDYDGTNNKVGVALKEGYIVVSYGCRSRTDAVVGHSPATMTDTKAAIRFVRANADLIGAGDTDKIVVTGTSGGGALSVIIAASGNSADYFESLYEVGAAGIDYVDGEYVSTISDAVWATIAYCPITDLGNACAAYDWTWGEARAELMADGSLSYKGASAEQVNANAEALTAIYEEYLDSLGLESVSAANLKNTIIDLMKAEIDESIEEIGIEQMKADLGDATWLTFAEDGTYTYDYDAHVLWVAQQTALKISPAFSNVGTGYGEFMNEDNLFGAPEDVYSPFNEYSWSIDATENKVGQDDTGKTWDEYMATEDGERLALQIKMTNPIPYLLDAEDGDSAPYWYVRYGMADRDSSFAVEAVLNAAMEADESIVDKTFEFAWLKPHSGDYDVPEAYAWLKDMLFKEAASNLTIEDATVTELVPTVDGKAVKVTWYKDGYLEASNSAKQLVNVYVPENATEESPIMLYVNNSGWRSNDYPTGSKATIQDGVDYDGTNDRVGVALKEGYVVVSYGCRSRGDVDENGVQIGHSPATMTDTKAVIRWLRANDAVIAGDTDKIVVTGTSGGGALSVVIAASGDSEDYFASLYEIGAAGIDYVDGKYVSTLSDAVWATIAYCPITDLGNACAAYEWTWGAARAQVMEEGKLSYKGATAEQVNANSAAMVEIYEEYLDSLGLESVSSENLRDTIIALMETEIAEAIEEIGIEQMKADLAATEYAGTWLTFNEDGTWTYDYDEHVLWVANKQALKIAPAFSNVGTGYGEKMNEDNLFGAADDVYAPFNEYSWSIDATENAVGQDDTGKTWDEYLATPEGEALALQIKMTSPIEYLLDAEDGKSAAHWYVRYGMADRDSSFAVEAVLNAAMEADDSITTKSFEFAWLQGHGGNYDVAEAYAWLKNIVPDTVLSTQNITVKDEAVEAEIYNIGGHNYFKLRDIAALLGDTYARFGVDFDGEAKEVYITTGADYVAVGGELEAAGDKSATCVLSAFDIYVDGELVEVAVYNIGGNNYFKLRDLAEAVGFTVNYNEATRTIEIL